MSVSVIPESAICTPYMFVSMVNMPFDLPESAICTPFLHGKKQSIASIDNDGANCTPYFLHQSTPSPLSTTSVQIVHPICSQV